MDACKDVEERNPWLHSNCLSKTVSHSVAKILLISMEISLLFPMIRYRNSGRFCDFLIFLHCSDIGTVRISFLLDGSDSCPGHLGYCKFT